MVNLDEYRHLYDNMDKLLSSSRVAEGYYSDEVIGHSLMESPRKALSIRSRIIFHKILFRYHYVHKNNLDRAAKEGDKLIELAREHSQLIIHHLEDFLEGMWSMIRALFQHRKTEKLQFLLSELSEIFNSLVKGQSFSNIHINQLEILSWQLRVLEIQADRFDKASWERNFQNEIKANKAKAFSKSMGKSLLMEAWKYFQEKDFDNCSLKCEQIMEEYNYPSYAQYRDCAQMFLLLLALNSNRIPSMKLNLRNAKKIWATGSKGPSPERRKVFSSLLSAKKEKWKDLIQKAVASEKKKREKQFLSAINEKEVFVFFGEQYLANA